jgi:exodeoxyribonuclease VII large subunit
MSQMLRLKLSEAREQFTALRMHRAFQTMLTRLGERAQRVDDVLAALERSIQSRLNAARQDWLRASAGITRYDFRHLLGLKRAALESRDRRFDTTFRQFVLARRNRLLQVEAILKERNPLTILNRGYSITRDAQGRIVRDAAQVSIGDDLSIRLARGELGTTVKDKKP